MSIRRKLLLTSLAGVVPLIAVGVLAWRVSRDAVSAEVRLGLDSVATVAAGRVSDTLLSTDDKLTATVGEDGVGGPLDEYLRDPTELNRQAILERLETATRQNRDLDAAAVYSLDGSLLAGATKLAGDDITEVAPALLERAERGVTVYGPAVKRDADSTRYLHIRLISDAAGDPLGVLVAECNLEPVVVLLRDSWDLNASTDIHLIQRRTDGSAQWITPPRFGPKLAFDTVIPATATNTLAMRSLEPTQSVVDDARDYRDVEVIAALTRVDPAGWGLVVKMDRAEAYAQIAQLRRTLILAFLATVALVAVVSSIIARSIIGRLRRVTDAATAISRGEFDRRVDDPSKDEVGRLAGAFDRMTSQLARDVSRRRQVEQLLEHQATHDALTGLPNRLLAHERLAEALERAKPGEVWVALLFCDLDQFKAINDGLGHSVGDDLLAEVAVRLRNGMRTGDTLARFGGDEFVVVCPDLADPVGASLVASRFRELLAAPFSVGFDKEVVVTMSVGSVITDDPDASPEMLIRDADAAMYRAKDLGRDRHVTLDDDIRAKATAGLSVLTDLRRSIDRGALTLEYQPVIVLETGQVQGFEALVRWPHPERGLLYPPQFLDLAERHGLTPALDRWVVGEACRQMAAWRMDFPEAAELTIWVNLSAPSLGSPAIVDAIEDALGASGLDAPSLTVEVIEGAFAGDNERPAAYLKTIRQLGVRVAVDDFGSGYSSLDRLRKIPFDMLKMDRSFVADIDSSAEARAIIEAVGALSRALGVGLVGEGVERESQHRALVDLGATWGQGYLFARPAPPDRAISIVKGMLVEAEPMMGG